MSAAVSLLASTYNLANTAYHEAGHALACLMWLGSFEYVTIEPRTFDDGHLRHHHHWPFAHGARVPLVLRRSRALCDLRFALAGFAAEEIYNGCETDEIRDLLAEDTFDDEQEHDNGVARVSVWRAYACSSWVKQRQRLVAQYELTKEFLLEHRLALAAVASTLLTAGTLAGHEVESICEGRLHHARWRSRGLPVFQGVLS